VITACVVIGPGSILTSSNVGAEHGYGLFWVVIVSVVFMQVYMALGAKLGVVSRQSTGSLIAERAGRWVAVLLGLSVFFISAAFQFGNNLGVHSAFQVYAQPSAGLLPARWAPAFNYVVVAFNALSIAFLFGFRNLYKAIERLMMIFVGLMLVSFALNLGFALWTAPPTPGEMLSGFVPDPEAFTNLSVLGLVGTTFVISAAFYQTYLVQQKGWDTAQLRDGLLDARVGALIMALITLMIMGTAATVLRGQTLSNVGDVAQQLEPMFGKKGQALFCLGLFSAAYSSFLINSMIGGFILADGLGLGSKPSDWAPRILTAGVLVTGMCVALYVIFAQWNPVPAIVAAQAVTVIAAPAVAGALWWLTSRREIMGELCNRPVTNVLAGIGFLILLSFAAYTALVKIPDKLEAYRAQPAQEAPAEPAGGD
jgi:Mn2+/Fe2+ NRAMP family transporter